MNVLTIFDQRISAIFEEGAPGSKLPLPFKRLAKRAVREMEDETFVIDGVDTAPALYTVLVSQRDNDLMMPLYLRIADEISQLIEAQAKKRGYTFVGRPLARFMVDPALRPGRFSVFAENIDPRTLARLRDEEEAYLSASSQQQVVVEQGFEPAPVQEDEDGFEVQPDFAATASDDLAAQEAEDVQDAAFDSFDIPAQDDFVAVVADEDVLASEDVAGKADDSLTATPNLDVELEVNEEPAGAPVEDEGEPEAPAAPSCTFTDLESGRVYRVAAQKALIGRDVSLDGVVVLDPNASRRHAELVYDGTGWVVRDLGSTNGTLVNDVDVTEAGLRNGDVLTIGLTNLEFREG